MKTRLPDSMLKGAKKTAPFYLRCIQDFPESDYKRMRSDKFARHVLRNFGKELNTLDEVSDKGQQDKPVKGGAFEFMVGEMLIMHGLVPFYTQVEMWKVPMSKMDFLLYDENEPVVFTCKFSLAERWRQAAFEGMFLKNIYRRGWCYLVSAKPGEVAQRNDDIDQGNIKGIDKCFLAGGEEFRDLLVSLSKKKFSVAHNVAPIKKQRHIVGAAAK